MRAKKAETETDKAAETVVPKPCKPVREMPQIFIGDDLRMGLKRSDFPRGLDGQIVWCNYQEQVWRERHAQLNAKRREQIEELRMQRIAMEAEIKAAQKKLAMLSLAQSRVGG